MALILLNLAGGDCVSDLQVLAGDDVFVGFEGIEGKDFLASSVES